MKDGESKEMYLETILRLRDAGARTRAVDVANELGFSRPSVSNAVKALEKDGFVKVADTGTLVLTEKGLKVAQEVYEKHCVLTKLLTCIGASAEVAEENACRIEHVLSEEMFAVIKKYAETL